MSKSDEEFSSFCRTLYKKAEVPAVQKQRSSQLKALYLYLRSAESMANQIVCGDFNVSQKYVLKLRFVLLCSNVINKHPHKNMACFETAVNRVKERAKIFLGQIEETKRGELRRFFDEIHNNNNNNTKDDSNVLKEIKKEENEKPISPVVKIGGNEFDSQHGVAPVVDQPPKVENENIKEPQPKEFVKYKVDPRSGLRKVFVDKRIVDDFLSHAFYHLEKGIEFCGILCGVLKGNAFYVTKCLLPDQEGDENSCSVKNDMQTFNYIMKHDLLQLGWIHIHPTQTCFLSSIDLATHFGYQQMLKESVAIVCSPSKIPDMGIFRIKENKMDFLMTSMKANKNIGKKFVKISNEILFENCSNAVCSYDACKGFKCEVIDLRKNKKVEYSVDFKPGGTRPPATVNVKTAPRTIQGNTSLPQQPKIVQPNIYTQTQQAYSFGANVNKRPQGNYVQPIRTNNPHVVNNPNRGNVPVRMNIPNTQRIMPNTQRVVPSAGNTAYRGNVNPQYYQQNNVRNNNVYVQPMYRPPVNNVQRNPYRPPTQNYNPPPKRNNNNNGKSGKKSELYGFNPGSKTKNIYSFEMPKEYR